MLLGLRSSHFKDLGGVIHDIKVVDKLVFIRSVLNFEI